MVVFITEGFVFSSNVVALIGQYFTVILLIINVIEYIQDSLLYIIVDLDDQALEVFEIRRKILYS